MKYLLKRLVVALGLAAFCSTPFAVFDPVNDDTDLFRNNPNIPSERPNVLIILDNTANWSSGGKFAAEKTALVNTFNGLDSSFNVGLMIMTQGGSCASGSTNGGYVRFGIRQLTPTNQAALSSVITGFTDASCGAGGDQGSAAAGGQAMYEAYAYFGGKTSRSGVLQTKRDYANNPNNTIAGPLPGNPFGSAGATIYTSPITDACAKSYIIYISNGPMDNGDDNPSAALYSGAGGLVPGAARFVLNPDTSGSNYLDEFAYYLASTGVNNLGSNQKIFTYTVEVDPTTNNQGLGLTALLKSAASKGSGKYFGVTSASGGAALTSALNSIFQEIQSVNSVFAASTLPVSVNVRGTNLNQLYIGVFRPDSTDQPRWLGNLKAYELKKDPSTGAIFTVDSNLNPAINSSTGFITSTAQSFWTSGNYPNSTYWSFRSSSLNGVGGDSDSPDGDLVEKGGAAQQVRGLYFGNGINGTPSRPLYTCTQGPNLPVCNTDYSASPSQLSATPFSTANTDITATSLNLGTRPISALTAAQVKSITALADSRAVSLDNTVSPVTLASITTNSITASVTSLANSVTRTISSISNGAVANSVTLTRPANGTAQGVVTGGHGLTNGQTVWITTSGTAQTQGATRFDTTGVAITYVNSTTFTYPISNGAEPNNSGIVVNSNTQVNVTTSTAHGFTNGESVTIAGATPTTFNGVKTITVDSATQFHYTNTVAPSPTLVSPTAAGATSTVTATLSAAAAAGTFGVGQQVTISGGNTATTTPTYSGTFTIASVTVNGSSQTTAFTYTTSSAITTAASGGPFTAAQSGTTATATVNTTLFPLGHGFNNGATVTISGASPSGFDVQAVITTTGPTATTFTYTVPTGLGNATANPTLLASTGTGPTVTGTLTNHGYSVGNSVTIAGATASAHNGPFTILTVPNANSFTYANAGGAALSPGGSPTVRLTSSPLAYATIPAHGYGSNGATVSNFTVAAATPSGYNVSNATATIVDANTVSYVLSGAQGTQTGAAPTATIPSTTAVATSVAHGFTEGESVSISGAAPSAFNTSGATVHVIDLNTFSYTLGSAQLTASGTILAASNSGSTSPQKVIDWIRGEDNFEDENGNTSFTDTRASMHGDVLHSRPAVVNYNRRQSDTANADNDVYIFYGGNDGVFRAVKGGFGSSSGDPAPGLEVWGFVAPEHFPNLSRLRTNSPGISSAYKKPYFFDGPIGAYTLDANADGKLDPSGSSGDKVWLFLGMRRGGRFIYALDVTDPLTPKMLWRKGCPSFETDTTKIDAATGCDLGWGELGQTWSEPKVVKINCTSASYNCGSTDPVLMFGAGYDATVEDLYPSSITSTTSTTDTSNGTVYTRSMGRGIYVVNARTGNIIWQASGHARADSSSHAYKQVSGMTYSIPSDIAVVVGDPTPKPFRAYVGDTGGRLWRVDFGDVNPANWTVARIGSIADRTTTATYTDALTGTTGTVIPGLRKFMNAPDVIGGAGFDMVVIGSGDREHPFDSSIINRVYGFKDFNQTSSPFSGSTQIHSSITHSNTFTYNSSSIPALLNVTSQCTEVPANCTGTAPEVAVGGVSASQNTAGALSASGNQGWYISLASGEKQVGATLASGSGVVQFATNQPSASAGGGSCSPNLGVARQYVVNYLDGSAYNGTTLYTQYAGGGFLPSPVLVYVGLGGATGTGSSSTTGVGVGGNISGGTIGIGAGTSTGGSGNVANAVVCYGATCSAAPGSVLFSRLRKFWYKEID